MALVGVIHLGALPGAPLSSDENPLSILESVGERAVSEAITLEKAGFDGIIVENFGDAPFFPMNVPVETVVAMSLIVGAVRQETKIPLGVNVLRNDAKTALAIGCLTGCQFIRVNVLSGAAVTDQGLVEGSASELLRERKRLKSSISIFADVLVKHAKSLYPLDLENAILDAKKRSLADAVIISGARTGVRPTSEVLKEANRAAMAADVPLYLGSGATAEALPEIAKYVQGIIVGSALRKNGKAGAPLDSKRVARLVKAWMSTRKKNKKSRTH